MNIQTGDRLLVNSTTFLSKAIRFFMKWYAKKYHKPTDYIFSHAGTFLWIEGGIYVAESVENGYRIRAFYDHYSMKDDLIIVRNKEQYHPFEQFQALEYAIYLQSVGNFYQYWGFLQWISLIVFGVNLFGKGNKFSTYCYESTYRIAKKVRPGEFAKNPEVVTCFDLYNRDTDEIIYDNHKK